MKEINIDKYLELVKKYSTINDLIYEEIGYAYDDPIILLKTKEEPNKLVCGGIHGDEQSGSFSILAMMMGMRVPPRTAFLPMVSPSAARRGRRRNIDSLDVNRGWGKSSKPLSKEGEVITKNIHKILPYAINGVLSLHETIGEKYMLFVNEIDNELPQWAYDIVSMASEKFEVVEDDCKKDFMKDYPKSKDGIVFNATDSSFETFLFNRKCNPVFTSEVPQKTSLKDRDYVNQNTILLFCRNIG